MTHRWISRYDTRIDGEVCEVFVCATCGTHRAKLNGEWVRWKRRHSSSIWLRTAAFLPKCPQARATEVHGE